MKINNSLLFLVCGVLLHGSVSAQTQTSNYISKFYSNPSQLTNSLIYDNGTNVGIGTNSPTNAKLEIVNAGGVHGRFAYDSDRFIEIVGNGNIRLRSTDGQNNPLNIIKEGLGDLLFKTGLNGATATRMVIMQGGNIGINTTNPLAKLHVSNGSLLLEGTTGSTPTSGAGNRLMWIPAKAAFRVGVVASNEWDDANIGDRSIAMGAGAKATALFSYSFGYNTVASGQFSTALGVGTTASGVSSMAIGGDNIASGNTATAMGYSTSATGQFSFTSGISTTSQAYGSFVTGRYNIIAGTTTGWVATDPLFVIGNGSGTSARSNAVTVLKNGKTLIGNPALSGFMGTPDGYLLFVQQGILAEKVKVAVGTTSDWSDYVFEKNYKLKSLDELEEYLSHNKHLPNIPSAEDVVKNGIDMAKMDAKLLEKIEELHLYIIQQNKEIESLKKEVLSLKK